MIYFFFFNDTATTEIYTLSLHDALPIFLDRWRPRHAERAARGLWRRAGGRERHRQDRKSTRLNSSHGYISYAVFCLKKKNTLSQPEHSPRGGHAGCDGSYGVCCTEITEQ